MISATHPLLIWIIRGGTVERVIELEPRALVPVVNAAKVAYYKGCCGGLSSEEELDAVAAPVRACVCGCSAAALAARPRGLGCAASHVIITLIRRQTGEAIFEYVVPMVSLTPMVQAALANENLPVDASAGCLWQLAADFAMPRDIQARLRSGSSGLLISPADPLSPVSRRAPRRARVLRSVRGSDVPVFVHRGALAAMLRHAEDTPDGAEVGGALLGQVATDPESNKLFLLVEQAVLLPSTGGQNWLRFGPESFTTIRKNQQGSARSSSRLIGMWHVHGPNHTQLFASTIDVYEFQSHFPEPWAVFAVVGRTLDVTGFFGWHRDGTVGPVTYAVYGQTRSHTWKEDAR